jgi:diguanylate cyclase (GGDEF)-like protein/PAS domain S-box-containing protein
MRRTGEDAADESAPPRSIKAARNMRDSDRLLRQIMDGLSPSIFVGLLTPDGILVCVNRAALDAIGAKPEEVLGRHFEDTPWWAASEASLQHLRAALEAAVRGVASRFDIVVQASGGRRLAMDFMLSPVFGGDGRVAYLVPSACDVTERKQAEHALRLTQFAVDHAQDAMLQVGADGRLRYANDTACRLLGYPRAALLGMPIHAIDMQTSEADWPQRWGALKEHGCLRFESAYRHCSGHAIPVQVSVSYIEYEGEECGFVYASDISERKAAEERMRYLAQYDALTGLPNHELLRERLSQAIDFAGRHRMHLTVLFIGLDRFRLVNEALGYARGDEVLRAVAHRLAGCVREIDTVARMGSDEFAVTLTGDAPHDGAPSRTWRLIEDALGQPVAIGGHELFITCSIGAAVFPEHGNSAGELLKNACAAMYLAKAQGRNTVHVYSEEFGGRDPERLPLEAAMRRVLELEHEREEFRVYFQPQVELSSGKIRGVEALLRWDQPEKGMLPPVRFIPIAEETGLILPIGEWILHAACVQQRAWQEQGIALERIGVNLSARQFRQTNLVRSVAQVLHETGVDPHCLELELTESILMQDVEAAIRTMCELKELGVRISLDDFGTGYSSLSYLKRFPIDTLKIDQSFVREITSDQNSAAIADAIIAMAHRLRLTVIAEGVETEGQLALLRERGCDQVQGFFLCKPLPGEELTRMLREIPALAMLAS